MKKFEDIASIAVTGAYPNTLAKNDTSEALADGTPLLADIFNHTWGWTQDLMERAGLTPDGSVEVAGASQLNDAMRLAKGVPGEMFIWLGNTDPASLTKPPRVLLLDGSFVLVTDYPELVANCYVGDANNGDQWVNNFGWFCRTDDTDHSSGTPKTTGTYLRLPDTRSLYVRDGYWGGTIDSIPGYTNTRQVERNNDLGQTHYHSIKDTHPVSPTDEGNYFLELNTSANAAAGSDLVVPTISNTLTATRIFRALQAPSTGSYGGDNIVNCFNAKMAVWY